MKTQPYGNKRSRPSDRGSWARGEVIQVFACFTPFSFLSAVLLNYAKASCSCSSGGGGGGWKGSSSQAHKSRWTNNCWRNRASRFDRAQPNCARSCRKRSSNMAISAVQTCTFTALALVPTKVLILHSCLSALKNSSTCHLSL